MPFLLMSGSTGPNVRLVQTLLNFLGAQPPLDVDGIFGPKTRAAVIAFQTQSRLVADGKVGPLTGQALAGGTLAAFLAKKNGTIRLI